MSYLFLAIVLAGGLTKGYCGKKIGGLAEHIYDAVYMNTVRFVLCALIGAVLCLVEGGTAALFNTQGIHIALIAGAAQAGFVTTWLLSVRTGAYTMIDAFLTLGILIPTVLCDIFFDEKVKLLQWFGFAVLVVAVYIMCSYNNQIKTKMTAGSFLLLVSCGVCSGICDYSQKLISKLYPEVSAATYNFYSYFFAVFVLAAIFFIVKPKKEKACGIGKFGIYIVVMAACLFLNSYFKTLAGVKLDAALIYPVCQGGGMVLSAIMAAVCFGEPIKPKSVVGMCLAFAALMIIMFA